MKLFKNNTNSHIFYLFSYEVCMSSIYLAKRIKLSNLRVILLLFDDISIHIFVFNQSIKISNVLCTAKWTFSRVVYNTTDAHEAFVNKRNDEIILFRFQQFCVFVFSVVENDWSEFAFWSVDVWHKRTRLECIWITIQCSLDCNYRLFDCFDYYCC